MKCFRRLAKVLSLIVSQTVIVSICEKYQMPFAACIIQLSVLFDKIGLPEFAFFVMPFLGIDLKLNILFEMVQHGARN